MHNPPATLKALFRGVLLTCVATACRAPRPAPAAPPALLPPDLDVSVEHWRGTALTGPIDGAEASLADSDQLVLRARFVAMEQRPQAALDGLSDAIELVVDAGSRAPVRDLSRLRTARVGLGERAERFLAELEASNAGNRTETVLEHEGALLRGVTTRIAARAAEWIEEPDNFLGEYPSLGAVPMGVSLFVSRLEDGSPRIALGFDGVARPFARERDKEPDARGARPASAPRPFGELVLFAARPRAQDGPFVVLFEPPFARPAARAWAAVVTFERGPGAEGDGTAAAVLSELARRATALGRIETLDPEQRTVLRALAQAGESTQPRVALSYLADATEAPLTADLALAAGDDWLVGLLAGIAAELEGRDRAALADIGWLIERATWRHAAAALSEGEPAPLIESVLLRHAGEAARYPGALGEAATASDDRRAFEARVVAENRLFLEDANPAARVRAHDWLTRRGAAVVGYDPLAEPGPRRAALERAAWQSPAAEQVQVGK